MNILFVCTGNTCRSCMAEAIFNKHCDIKNIKAYSAGMSIEKNSITSKHSAAVVMENLGLDISNRKAVGLTESMLSKADLILTMTNYMSSIIKDQFESIKDKVHPLNLYVNRNGDVSDPYGGSLDIYKNTYRDMELSIKLLIKKLREDKGI
ncbi:low molecular weight protein arginine phosphatase [Clostridium akagii]|uniref:low molecular weight protein arginine phosphatase n=1 Tax=Clostridium akagii TaxID=91623 RepID=UPI00047D69AC|nr:low molecular weight protein arginine phosphatase [Clostridium akagii]